MIPKTSSKAVAVVVALWVAACAAALALATTSTQAVAQQGCRGGGSPSPSGSASESPAESELPVPSLPVSVPPDPAPDHKRAAAQPAPLPVPQEHDADEADAPAAQQASCDSTVTIAYEAGKNPKFTGKVGSDEPMCKRARDVTIKKVKRGADRTVGKATTNAKGKYTVPARQTRGRFYAKVSKATTENGDGQPVTCKPARSRTIRP